MLKSTPKRLIFLGTFLALGTVFSSCADEDLMSELFEQQQQNPPAEPGADNPETPQGSNQDPGDPVTFESQLEINSTPCDFGLDTLQANGTLALECSLDLGGQTVTLPAGVTLEYAGGQIINGTLVFNGGYIDGKLMNKDLTLQGSVSLTSDTFQLFPERWELVQGQTTSEIAQKNNDVLEGLMFYTKELGANIFLIDKFDAYFEVSKVTSTTTNQNFYPSLEAVNIPSDFTLSMTDNTILRVFPTSGDVAAALIGIREESNVTVRGGILYGDRDLRTYSSANAEEGSHLMTIRSGKNVLIEGVTFTMGSLGGLNINSVGHTFDANYDPTQNVTVRSCTFDTNRMMSLALTDGNLIDIDSNTFLNNGQPTSKSDGGVVGFAINLEPVRTRDSQTNQLVEYQKVHDVTIRNNVERRSREGSIIVFIGQRIIVENNDFETSASYSLASDTQFRNNTFTASSTSSGKPAIIVGGPGETVFNNSVSGNTIIGYGLGIAAYFKDVEIAGNTFVNCNTGIQLNEVEDIVIQGNRFQNANGGRGITSIITTAKNVTIQNNEFDTQSNPFYFVQLNLNATSGDLVNILNNDILGSASAVISSSSGITFKGNTSNGGVQIINGSYIEVSNNTLSPTNAHGIHLKQEISFSEIMDNIINVSPNFECIRDEANGAVSVTNNTCG